MSFTQKCLTLTIAFSFFALSSFAMAHKAEVKGDYLMQQAKAELNEKNGFFSNTGLSSLNNKRKKAIKYYDAAAEYFIKSFSWAKAGEAFENAAVLCLKIEKKKIKAQEYYDAAANCYQQMGDDGHNNYIICLEKLALTCINIGNYDCAGEACKKLGDQNQDLNIEKSILYYEKALSYFRVAQKDHSAYKISLKIGELLARAGYYDDAINDFDDALHYAESVSDLNSMIKEILFYKAICYAMSEDLVAIERLIKTLTDQGLSEEPHVIFLQKINSAIRACP